MSTLTELQQLLHEKYDIPLEDLAPDVSMQDKGLDSLAIAEFMFAVEDHFHIVLPDDDPDINTLNQLADLVDRTCAAKAAVVPASPASPASPAPAADDESIDAVHTESTVHVAPETSAATVDK